MGNRMFFVFVFNSASFYEIDIARKKKCMTNEDAV
jgi:hypothetical protein